MRRAASPATPPRPLRSLQEELERLRPWVAPGCLGEDVDDFLEPKLVEVSDWEANLKMLAEAAKGSDRIPAELPVDRFRVSLQPLKDTVRRQVRDLQESMKTVLRRKAQEEKEKLAKFVANMQATLNTSATSLEDIGKAGKEAEMLTGVMPQMRQLRSRLKAKNDLLGKLSQLGTGVALGGGAGDVLVDTSALDSEVWLPAAFVAS